MLTRDQQLLLTVAPTFLIAVYLARKAAAARPQHFRLSDYFLAGGQIGPTNTRANAVGSNIALANGLWYFVVLGYLDGVLGITAQVTWCLSIYLVGFMVPVILDAARRGETLHGFLGSAYGSPKMRSACALVTGTGYLLNFGFETYLCGTIFSSILGGDERLKWVLIVALVLSTSVYISIAGFLGNITSDRKQNAIGIATIVAITGLTIWHFGLSQSVPSDASNTPIVVGVSWSKYLGIVAYTSLFNMVDVSNWQSIAANKDLPTEGRSRKLKGAWTETAVIAFFFPGVFGVLIGCLLRSTSGIEDAKIFGHLFESILPFSNSIIDTLLRGALLMGLFVLAIGYAENLLSAAQFTFMADVFRRHEYDGLVRPNADTPQGDESQKEREDRFVRGCQRRTFAIAIIAITAFISAMALMGRGDINAGEGVIFGFMFLIFGSAISMFPAIAYAVFRHKQRKACSDPASRITAGISIAAGYIVAMSPLCFPQFVELSPVFTIAVASVVFLVLRPTLVTFGIAGEKL